MTHLFSTNHKQSSETGSTPSSFQEKDQKSRRVSEWYKFNTEQDFLIFESQKLRAQIHNSAEELFQHVMGMFSLKPWVKKYPFVSVGTAFSVGVVSSSDYASHLAKEAQAVSQLLNLSAIAVLKSVVEEVAKQVQQ